MNSYLIGAFIFNTATDAARHISPWNWHRLSIRLRELNPGDQLHVDGTHTITVLSGVNHAFVFTN